MLRKSVCFLLRPGVGGTSGSKRATDCSLWFAHRLVRYNTSDTKDDVGSPMNNEVDISKNMDVYHHHGIDFIDRAAAAVHRLLQVLISARRQSANEVYVKRVLQEQIGLNEYDIERMWQCDDYGGQVFRLSVRHQIEPVVKYLKSYGLCGRGLHTILREYPMILGMDVDKDLMPMIEFLESVLNGRGPAALLRYPWILACEADVLSRVRDDVVSRGHGAVLDMFLWDYTESYCQVAVNWEAFVREGRDRELLVALDAVFDERRRVAGDITYMSGSLSGSNTAAGAKKDSTIVEAERALLELVSNST